VSKAGDDSIFASRGNSLLWRRCRYVKCITNKKLDYFNLPPPSSSFFPHPTIQYSWKTNHFYLLFRNGVILWSFWITAQNNDDDLLSPAEVQMEINLSTFVLMYNHNVIFFFISSFIPFLFCYSPSLLFVLWCSISNVINSSALTVDFFYFSWVTFLHLYCFLFWILAQISNTFIDCLVFSITKYIYIMSMFVYVSLCVSMYVYVCLCLCMSMYVYVYVFLCMSMFIYVYVCLCMSMYVCICRCVCL